MGLIIWLIIGGIVGWLASIIMRTDAQQGLLLNIIVGIVGALIGGFLFGSLFGEGTINQNPLDLGSILVSLLGAIVLLGIVNLFRRGTVR
ncbi:MAG: GlsB/YeaQ/YmgE family stress response membrane protein [Chloroflexi bacterium]|nr:GlsB/YeaQ/YmgE family stress response membrane protein [Chloroflexota bacterium]